MNDEKRTAALQEAKRYDVMAQIADDDGIADEYQIKAAIFRAIAEDYA